MADRTLHTGGRRVVFLCDGGVQHLGHGVYYVHVVYGQDYRLTQILITLYVSGNADLVDDVRHQRLKARLGAVQCGVFTSGSLYSGARSRLTHTAQKGRYVAGLGHEVGDARCGTVRNDLVVYKAGHHDGLRAGACLRQTVQHLKSVELRQNEVADKHIRLLL